MERLTNKEYNEQVCERTKQFALQVIDLSNKIPDKGSVKVINRQLLRAATSVASNFRAACRGRSNAEFYSKLCTVVEEADETQFWLEMLVDSKLTDNKHSDVIKLIGEVTEIEAITTSIKNKWIKNIIKTHKTAKHE
jgi:four helix bundle protein